MPKSSCVLQGENIRVNARDPTSSRPFPLVIKPSRVFRRLKVAGPRETSTFPPAAFTFSSSPSRNSTQLLISSMKRFASKSTLVSVEKMACTVNALTSLIRDAYFAALHRNLGQPLHRIDQQDPEAPPHPVLFRIHRLWCIPRLLPSVHIDNKT